MLMILFIPIKRVLCGIDRSAARCSDAIAGFAKVMPLHVGDPPGGFCLPVSRNERMKHPDAPDDSAGGV